MANPEFSFIYEVTIRQYKEDGLFNETTYDEHDVLILANGLREATDKAEDYAEARNQDGPYKFYDVVAVEEIDTVYIGNAYDPEDDPEDNYVENPSDNGFELFYVNSKTGEKIPVKDSDPGWGLYQWPRL